MPPKRRIDSEEDTEEVDTTSGSDETSSSEEKVESYQTQGTEPPEVILTNNPNDERHTVDDARPVRTPPNHTLRPSQTEKEDLRQMQKEVQQQSQGQERHPQQAVPSSSQLKEPVRHHPPPPSDLQLQAENAMHMLRNNPNDEFAPVEDAHHVTTPRGDSRKTAEPAGVVLRNAPHDEAIPVSARGSSIDTPSKRSGGGAGVMAPTDDEESTEEDEQGGASRGYANQRPEAIDTEAEVPATVIPNLEYKPQDYAKINATASREMQELFKHILDYQPVIPELPAKLRTFIPDYVPSIGDLDPFCKIPRPDGRPDGLGIYVLDEPSVSQSNPAVVMLELRATNIHSSGGLAEVVDSFEDAANRPEVIDRWIADVKKVHYKKALPTINYQKPMPEIESLLQVWPPEFEEFLNSDVQLPPPHIDLDLDQYVRTLCCILDIPTYNSLIDSLHVMFTLYQEFRANQHFQHE
ncbi:hypothetical protein DQ04_00631090 [Trypanosoma grayi]|uniref:hypothetical protein n=1 Tax=Trypanosoma grayi TaxID=71804 RepID=UPI0004F426EB|nr:hypothetical protein DQ04_00631090 [Trypanosoma grayi]KEG14085.1 hypothetical protein DQ04_00631090 [Trypanosoma grayi]